MTAKTHRKPKHRHKAPRRRNSMMESLGFSETRAVSYVTTSPNPTARVSRPATQPTPPSVPLEPDPMVDSLADWAPIAVDSSGLNRRMRWSLVLLWVAILGGLGAAAYWMYQSPTATADTAVALVSADATALETSLGELEVVATALDPGDIDPSSGATAATAAVDDAGRALFASSGGLADRDAAMRLSATDASTHALDASRTLNTTMAYIAAVSPILTAPTLETDPEAIDLATAATDFGTWITRFDQVRNALPDSVLSKVTTELTRISNGLEATQRDYLDAMREDDRVAALDVVRSLEGSMVEVWALLGTETEALRQSILERIEAARESLDSVG